VKGEVGQPDEFAQPIAEGFLGTRCPGREALGSLADAPGDVREGLVAVPPRGDRLAVPGQGLQLPERGGLPAVDRPQDDRDDAGRPLARIFHPDSE
jgi:hypothetical protein